MAEASSLRSGSTCLSTVVPLTWRDGGQKRTQNLGDNTVNATLVGQIDVGLPFYKHWLGPESLLLMALSKETSTYRATALNLSNGVSHTWEPAEKCNISAQVLPIRIIDVNGKLVENYDTYIRPHLYASADLKHLCWIGSSESWIVFDVVSGAIRRQPRGHRTPGSKQAVWLADNETFAEPVCTRDGEWIGHFNVYSTQSYAESKVRATHVKNGLCLGATDGNQIVIRALLRGGGAAGRTGEITLLLVTYRDNGMQAEEFQAAIPTGWILLEATLCQSRRQLAWLLTSGFQSERRYAIWTSSFDGQSWALVGHITGLEYTHTISDRGAEDIVYDLEWTPDGGAVSFVWKNGAYVLPVAASNVPL